MKLKVTYIILSVVSFLIAGATYSSWHNLYVAIVFLLFGIVFAISAAERKTRKQVYQNCPNCGSPVIQGYQYCGKCGRKLV